MIFASRANEGTRGRAPEAPAGEATFRLRVMPYREYERVSAAVEPLLGYPAAEFLADPGFLREQIAPDDRPAFDALDPASMTSGGALTLRFRHREGRVVWAELTYRPVKEGGRTVAVDGTIRDITRWWRVAATLERTKRMLSDGFDGVATVDTVTHRFLTMDSRAMTLLAVDRGGAVPKLALSDVFEPALAERLATTGALIAAGEIDRSSVQTTIKRCDRTERPVVVRVGATETSPPGLLLVFEDLSSERRLTAERKRYESAVAAASDAIVMIDSSKSLLFANAAFCRLSGYDASECTGYRPDILRALIPEPSFWTTVGDDRAWQGLVRGIGKSDKHLQLMVSASPVPAAEVEDRGCVIVMHEVSGEHAAMIALDRERAARHRLTGALANLEESASIESVAQTMCSAVAALPEVAAALLLDLTVPNEPRVLGISPDRGFEALPRYLMTPDKAVSLPERLSRGGWVEEISLLAGRMGGPEFAVAGASLVVISPVHHGERPLGLLATVGSGDLRNQQRSLADLAAAAAGLLSPGLLERAEQRRIRRELQAILVDRSFRPIFQSIIRLQDVSTVGWEATTRFNDGSSPSIRFADALRAGMTVDLEAAAVGQAVAETELNDPPGWLSLNVSTAFLAAGERLLELLPERRPVVLELASVSDLPKAACDTLAHLPDRIRVAVDSTSDEMHTLHGIVNIRPAFVKLPMDVVRGIQGDTVRQALVAGLEHFARNTGSELIAVGVETEPELTTLIDLGVGYGQGNYLGPPGFFPVADSAPRTPVE